MFLVNWVPLLTFRLRQAFTFIGGLFVWFFVPETKGLSLEEMDARLYGDSRAGPKVFEKTTQLLEVVTEEITRHFPERVSALRDFFAI